MYVGHVYIRTCGYQCWYMRVVVCALVFVYVWLCHVYVRVCGRVTCVCDACRVCIRVRVWSRVCMCALVFMYVCVVVSRVLRVPGCHVFVRTCVVVSRVCVRVVSPL